MTDPFIHGCTNPWHQVAVATKFRTVAHNTFGSSIWNLLHVTILVTRILRWLPDFYKIRAPLS
jgi:hypothetical protein